MRDLKSNSVTTSSKINLKVRPFCLAIILPKNKRAKKISLQILYISIQILIFMITCYTLHSEHQ